MKLHNETLLLSATDLSNHLYCHHLTELNRQVALGKLKRPYRNDPALEVLEKRGREHEQAYVDYLRSSGKSVIDLRGQNVESTIDAMRKGFDVIVQARLEAEPWMGLADILIRQNGTSNFGDYCYEIQDTKLAQNTRAATILQLCLYTDLLERLQGMRPKKMYVVKPGDKFTTEQYFYSDFKAYYRLCRTNYEKKIALGGIETYPEAVEHCGICSWWSTCDKRREADDHLSLVAGMRNAHIHELHKQDITTLKTFARAEELETPDRGNKESLLKRQSQAKVQLDGREQEKLLYKLLPIEPGRGLHRLPQPGRGDIYFDIEGDAFYPDGGLEYLLGYAFRDDSSTLVYNKLWATTRQEEKKAFQEFMTVVTARHKKYPDFHIYHFAPYEPSALKRLARVHAVYEKEIDDLLREQRFVDLHAVFKEALLASVKRYSLKDLEKFTAYIRKADLHHAGKARKAVECALELNEYNSLPTETLDTVVVYNEDDCLATEALHAWLEKLRADLVNEGYDFRRPAVSENDVSEKLQNQEIRSLSLFTSLTNNLPDDRDSWSEEQHARWLLAHQIDYFRREDKSAWWEYFRVHEMDEEELLDERKAIAGLTFLCEVPKKKNERNVTHRFRYPPQELSISEGDRVDEVKGDVIGEVTAISPEQCTIDIKRASKTVDRTPTAIHVYDRIDPGTLWTSIMNLAQEIDDDGLDHKWPHHASKDLLLRRKPQLNGGKEGANSLPGEDIVDTAIRIALDLNKSILPVQGPPGTGKTYTGAKMIISLIKAKKKIGVTAISHRVVTTLFEKVKELADNENFSLGFVHKVTNTMDYLPEWIVQEKDKSKVLTAIQSNNVAGGTAWLWADDEMNDCLDYLFIDEAGQMSLSQALAASRAAKNIILLGDPQQLEQPQKGAHPEGSDVAALTYLLEGRPTMPEGKGLFLGVTRRLHPHIAKFTSEIFYEEKLTSLPGLENQVVSGGTPFDGAGLFYRPVVHSGRQNSSIEEVSAIKNIVDNLVSTANWTDATNITRKLTKTDILVVAPYNAQVGLLIEALPGIAVGTVDKFQGKEAPVVIYSMTSSSVHDAPRGMTFLFNPNRLNVATSRAKSVCILIASPLLFEADCNTIEQMRWANALCRYRELAKPV
jgi:predicted RecB family nuclease